MEQQLTIEKKLLDFLNFEKAPVPGQVIIDNIKLWIDELPNASGIRYYSPYEYYQVGECVFHAAKIFNSTFIVDKIDGDIIIARFDDGRIVTLEQGRDRPLDISFATKPHICDPENVLESALQKSLIVKIDNLYTTKCLEETFHFSQLSSIQALANYYNYLKSLCKEDEEKKIRQLTEVQEKRQIQCFYYIVKINNFESILKYGIMARNLAPHERESFANEDIQGHRHIKVINPKLGFTLHDYVPLYVKVPPPFLYSFRDSQDTFVYIEVDPKVLINPGVMIANMNARSDKARITDDILSLNSLNWDILRAKYWNSDSQEETKINSLYRQAEIDVPLRISPDMFIGIGVYDWSSLQLISSTVSQLGMSTPVRINKDLYF